MSICGQRCSTCSGSRRSRTPTARGESGPEDDTIAIAHLDQTWGQRVETRSPNVAVSERGFRYLLFGAPDGGAREELYDAERDARELEDQVESEPDVAVRMREQAKQYLALEPSWKEPEQLELDELQLNQLRALGYAVPGR
jgi:hypothetical protein